MTRKASAVTSDPLHRIAEAKAVREAAEALLRTLSSTLDALARLLAPPPPNHAYALLDAVEGVDRVPTWQQIAAALQAYREAVAGERRIVEHELTAEQWAWGSGAQRTPEGNS